MVQVLKPYVEQVIKDLDLPADQKAVLILDCYPVHIGEAFRTYVFTDFPNVFLIFIPANCKSIIFYSINFQALTQHAGTGIFQPADVGLQRVVKHSLRQKALRFLVKAYGEQLEHGLTPEQVKFST